MQFLIDFCLKIVIFSCFRAGFAVFHEFFVSRETFFATIASEGGKWLKVTIILYKITFDNMEVLYPSPFLCFFCFLGLLHFLMLFYAFFAHFYCFFLIFTCFFLLVFCLFHVKHYHKIIILLLYPDILMIFL